MKKEELRIENLVQRENHDHSIDVTTTLLASNIRTLTSFHIEGATYG